MISSLTPREYTSAVSKKLMPASTALRKKGMAACSSRTQGRHLRIAVAHAAQAEAGDLDAGMAEIGVLHGWASYRVRSQAVNSATVCWNFRRVSRITNSTFCGASSMAKCGPSRSPRASRVM